MPVTLRKKLGGGYTISTPGGVKAKGTTLKKALRQRNLLNAAERNPNFKPRGY